MGEAQRVERHVIRESSPFYGLLDYYCFMAKNLYNHANYIVRQKFLESRNWVRYRELNDVLMNDKEFPDYREMPTAQSAQQTLKLLDKNWESFFKAIKVWKKDKSKFLGKPELPKYKKKDGRSLLMLTNQNVKLTGGVLSFPKKFKGFTLKTRIEENKRFISFQMVRFLPKPNHIIVEVVYKVEVPDLLEDNGIYMSMDLGVNNLVAVTNNFGGKPIIVNGRVVKSINQFYNKKISHYRSIANTVNDRYYTRRMNRITTWRNRKIEGYMHKTSQYLIAYALQHNVSKIGIGYNDGWKQEAEMGRKNNQTFVNIPFLKFIEKLQYKAEDVGIEIILTEESYTSGTSFLDGESPTEENYDKRRRKCRGLFRTNEGMLVNSDVNGSLQISKKAFPNADPRLWDSGCVLQPIKISFAV